MIFTIRALQVQLEESINPIDDFINHQLKDRELKNYKRNIYFTRIIGIEQSREAYLEQIHGLDDKLGQKKSYLRLDSLQYQISPKESERYIAIYEKWLQNKTAGAKALYELEFPTRLENDMLELTQKYAFNKVVETYKKGVTSPSESMIKNFSVKLLGWMGYYLPKLYQGESMTLPKVVYIGDIKRQELLFLYFLSLMGCDILYMNPKQDIAKDYPECHSFSKLLDYGVYEALDVPKFNKHFEAKVSEPVHLAVNQHSVLTYEELANLSTSIVMITILDEKGKPYKSGSGVVIYKEGYILTNFHVVEGGAGFIVRFENEEACYETNRIIKYHPDFDLAIIKVEKLCRPLPIYSGNALVRGQKVVAIGSPLGLFNSVSDGIISAFRQMNEVDMIQFTAPISQGSSGGALLDMYGRVIGISTAGMDEGQNLNLAVSYQMIQCFASNYIVQM